jgi:hypothetical protein
VAIVVIVVVVIGTDAGTTTSTGGISEGSGRLLATPRNAVSAHRLPMTLMMI